MASIWPPKTCSQSIIYKDKQYAHTVQWLIHGGRIFTVETACPAWIKKKRREAIRLSDEFLKSTFLEMFGDLILNTKGYKRYLLPEVLFFQEGPGIRKWQFQHSGIKLLNVKNIINGLLDLSNTSRYVSIKEVGKSYRHFLAEENNLVMATSGVTWGKVAWVSKEHLPL